MELRDKIIELLASTIESEKDRIKQRVLSDLKNIEDYYTYDKVEFKQNVENSQYCIERINQNSDDEVWKRIIISSFMERIIKSLKTYFNKTYICCRMDIFMTDKTRQDVIQSEMSMYNKKLNSFLDLIVSEIENRNIQFNLEDLTLIEYGKNKWYFSDKTNKISFQHIFAWGEINRPHYRWLVK